MIYMIFLRHFFMPAATLLKSIPFEKTAHISVRSYIPPILPGKVPRLVSLVAFFKSRKQDQLPSEQQGLFHILFGDVR